MSKKKSKQNTGRVQHDRMLTVVVKSRTPDLHRKDISDWQRAKRYALNVERPRMSQLQELFSYISDDAHLTSQIMLRKSRTFAREFELVREGGKADAKLAEDFARIPAVRNITNAILDAQLFGYSLIELEPRPGSPDPLGVTVIDRRHIDPVHGLLLPDISDTEGIPYREMREYGRFVLEFRSEGLGLLDKAVPHALFKRFAQSCWSEFCEVYGMPPRVIKTNTQDQALREEYNRILANMGSGASAVIDIDDEIEFVATNASNGEAYEGLIRLCNNEMSLLINGAVLGQDTRYGSNAKEQASSELSDEIAEADANFVETAMNVTVIPAMAELGFLPAGLRFQFPKQEDTEKLFTQTIQAAQYFDIDTNWVRNKFGIEVTGPRAIPSAPQLTQPGFSPFA